MPQKIFLSDGSIEANIAFASNAAHIDKARVALCARQACLDDFVQSLPAGYDTPVGEAGIRLSGGQRQRIGIARALYANSKVLVLDEATNALDEKTERNVIEQLLHPGQDYTVIVISHNPASVNNCHRILRVESGEANWQT